jgi:hypothetical protein
VMPSLPEVIAEILVPPNRRTKCGACPDAQ